MVRKVICTNISYVFSKQVPSRVFFLHFPFIYIRMIYSQPFDFRCQGASWQGLYKLKSCVSLQNKCHHVYISFFFHFYSNDTHFFSFDFQQRAAYINGSSVNNFRQIISSHWANKMGSSSSTLHEGIDISKEQFW